MKLDSNWLDEFQLLDATEKNPAGSPPAKKLSYLLRPAFIAAPGKVLVWGDWSNIEARVLPWLAASPGAEEKLDIFRLVDSDPKQPDVYMRTAARLTTPSQRHGMELDELWEAFHNEASAQQARQEVRQSRGKVPELSLGFGGGIGALIAMGVNYRVYVDVPTAKTVVAGWREENQWAVDFWGKHGRNGSSGLWGAANRAIEQPDTLHEAGRVAFAHDRSYLGGSLFMALPCGRLLTYPRIKWEWREVENKQTKKLEDRYQLTYMKGYGRSAVWYGKFAENATQATAASVLRRTLKRLARLPSDDWMPVVAHVHDEVTVQTDEALESDASAVLAGEMERNDVWDAGLPLKSEVKSNWFVTKAGD